MVAAGAVTVAVEAATGAAAKVTEAAVRCGSVRGATEVAVVNGARAGFCCRSGAMGAMKAAELNGARAGFCYRSGAVGTAVAEAATGATVEAATGAAVETVGEMKSGAIV